MSGYTLHAESRIFIAGHRGMVGSALERRLRAEGFSNLLLAGREVVDLRDQVAVDQFVAHHRPDVIILAAARVGGIKANIAKPAEFLFENLQIQNNVIHAAHLHGVKQFVFLGSSCIYPRECPQPMREDHLLTGPLEPTNEGYALAKIAGLKMTEYYKRQYGFNCLNLMPCNLYGPNDSFDLEHSHVLSALVKRFTDGAAEGVARISLWGSGRARREFLHVDDLARAVLFFLRGPQTHIDLLNVGCGTDVSIKELAELVARGAGFTGSIEWDTTKPDGMMRKCMDVSRMRALGFTPAIDLETGIAQMIEIYKRLRAL